MIHTTAFIVQANLQFLFLNGTKIAGFVWSVVQRQKYSIHYRRGQRKAAQSRDNVSIMLRLPQTTGAKRLRLTFVPNVAQRVHVMSLLTAFHITREQLWCHYKPTRLRNSHLQFVDTWKHFQPFLRRSRTISICDWATKTGTLKTKPRCLPDALPSGFCA